MGRKIPLAVLALVLLLFSLAAAQHKVVIRQWDVPTPNSRPHDPEVAPDGSLWYTGQLANKLGRLDPKTGSIHEFPLKTAESGLPWAVKNSVPSP
jgi:streptogramin lyase